MSVAIDSLSDAVEFVTGQSEDCDVVFSDEILQFRIVIQGDRYKGTVPGELAKAIGELQEGLYKSAAFVLYGDTDTRRLTTEQKLAVELVFKVREGSTDLQSPIDGVVEIVKGALVDMDPILRAKVIVAIVAIVAGGALCWKMLEQNADIKKAEIEQQLETTKEVEQTKRLTLFKDFALEHSAVAKFEQASTEGGRAIVRSASDASSISIGAVKLDKSDIKDVNRRASRVASESKTVKADFRIYAAEGRQDASTRYTLAGSNLDEFPIVVNHEDFSGDELEKLWNAARARRAIPLNIEVTVRRGKVVSATLLKVL